MTYLNPIYEGGGKLYSLVCNIGKKYFIPPSNVNFECKCYVPGEANAPIAFPKIPPCIFCMLTCLQVNLVMNYLVQIIKINYLAHQDTKQSNSYLICSGLVYQHSN